jgi:hypothetical protein
MTERLRVTPTLEASAGLPDVATHLAAWRADTHTTTTSLRTLRAQVEEQARFLESPRGALEYLDFFIEWFERALIELAAVGDTLGEGGDDRGDLLRRLAETAGAEQQRVVGFRDKWINKPLPYEQMRPVLTAIATTVRDQLDDYRDLPLAAAALTPVRPPASAAGTDASTPPPPRLSLDRRALFNRLLPTGREEGGDK